MMEPVTPPLVEQPTPAPTRKWTNARIAEVIAGVLAVLVALGVDLDFGDVDPEVVIAGVAGLVTVAGGVVSYFTKNRATT